MFTVGRPRKYQTEQELTEAIQSYFDETDFELWTVTGLALSVGLDRKALIEYGKQEKYSNTIKRAKDMVEYSYEVSLRKKGDSGTIFGLKNFGWKDRQEIQQTVKDITTLDKVMAQLDDTD